MALLFTCVVDKTLHFLLFVGVYKTPLIMNRNNIIALIKRFVRVFQTIVWKIRKNIFIFINVFRHALEQVLM